MEASHQGPEGGTGGPVGVEVPSSGADLHPGDCGKGAIAQTAALSLRRTVTSKGDRRLRVHLPHRLPWGCWLCLVRCPWG